MGRKPKLTNKLIEELCAAARTSCFREMACAKVGIQSGTLRRWLRQAREDREAEIDSMFVKLDDALDLALEQTQGKFIAAIIGQGVKKDWHALEWILRHMDPKRFGQNATQRIEMSGKDGAPLAAVVVLPPQEPLATGGAGAAAEAADDDDPDHG